MQETTRVCNRCNGIAVEIEELSNGQVKMGCQKCGKTFIANIGRLEQWHINLNKRISYFQRRKKWARELLKDAGLTKPGDSITGIFEEDEFLITIGPRKGVRISEEHPW
ncbi:MAG TPA: hypothetical protein PKL09_04250 [bacterium]|nr:hypothetical protein [bacterium]HNS34024.1 hypothetical protein [bacterium]HNW09186.1 hypothetical protein [bacterium]HNZ73430.1 hypothetical protein [bacterium]HOH66872.1 hypothetical protein [bacterium]